MATKIKRTRRRSYEKWIRDYKPVQNTVSNREEFDGFLFETYGEDLAFVSEKAQAEPAKVWTILDSDGKLTLTNGFHIVNRYGYMVTEIPFTGTEPIEVKAD